MKITFDDFARALGNARLEFYRFYSPSWAEPVALERLRNELARPVAAPRGDAKRTRRATPQVHRVASSSLARAA